MRAPRLELMFLSRRFQFRVLQGPYGEWFYVFRTPRFAAYGNNLSDWLENLLPTYDEKLDEKELRLLIRYLKAWLAVKGESTNCFFRRQLADAISALEEKQNALGR